MLRICLPLSTDLKISSGFTYRWHMNFFWGAFFPREHFFWGLFVWEHFLESIWWGAFFWGASGSTPIIQIGLEFFCSKMGLLKFVWLKNGPAQIWLAQKWACSNLGWLKFGSAQIWVGSNLGLLKFGPLKFGRSNLGCSKTAWHHQSVIFHPKVSFLKLLL